MDGKELIRNKIELKLRQNDIKILDTKVFEQNDYYLYVEINTLEYNKKNNSKENSFFKF